jgi:5-methyltetrahydropteroyltriglutamate--homocysteine methyltransferase
MVWTTTLGFPRIGTHRQLKRACERFWAGALTQAELYATAASLRRAHWATQVTAGLDQVPVGDFSLYDHVLDAIALVGAVPGRYVWPATATQVDLHTYFAMARGRQQGGLDVPAMQMTKWFNTNYHFVVPEWHADQRFRLASTKPFDELAEARSLGVPARPVLLGPFSLALLGRSNDASLDPLGETLDGLLEVYAGVVTRLAATGAEWIQLDEPCLVQDRTPAELDAFGRAYARLAEHKGAAKLLVATYFGQLGEAFPGLISLPIDGLALDLVHGPENLELLRRHGLPADKTLLAGVVNGRNVWATDLDASLATLEAVAEVVPLARLGVSTSCSLLHVPYDASREHQLDPTVRGWLAFAQQKLGELTTLARGLVDGRGAIELELRTSSRIRAERRRARSSEPSGAATACLREAPAPRPPFPERVPLQQARLGLPILPTTTIGSFPQTPELRRARRKLEAGELSESAYTAQLKDTIAETIRTQEALGLDVLAHGEPERNDMVQYFGEQLSGVAVTHEGWVQSYGTRCVRPPIIHGTVTRPRPMTVEWSVFAQSLTAKPVKAMLTGPVTILNWSFVRDDQSLAATCREIAAALREEVADLDAAGLAVIQVDEPALREGLPLRREAWADYLEWAVACFRLTIDVAAPGTQIHSHMCYSAVDDILDAIAAMDVDVLSIENARSGDHLLRALRRAGYARDLGPGVYDIHSPRVPAEDEMLGLVHAALGALPAEHLWVNPDCGLKTRTWEEALPSLRGLVGAAHRARMSLSASTTEARATGAG